jgi:DNA-binding MarR family transcriptional regulator
MDEVSGVREELIEGIADLFTDVMRTVLSVRPRSLMRLNITVGEHKCMMAVGRLGCPSMKELSEHLQLKPSTVTGLVNGLVQRGLAERRTDAEDRRMVRVALTTEGKRRRDRRRKAKRQQLLASLAGIGDEQLRRVRDALEILAEAGRRASDGAAASASLPAAPLHDSEHAAEARRSTGARARPAPPDEAPRGFAREARYP